jgi:glycosyltransferase involved in cell wall biosynthesis
MALRIANFVDSSLEALERKGNLSHALNLYNPQDAADKVIHFTVYPSDARYSEAFASHRVEIFPFFDRARASLLSAVVSVPAAFARVVRKIRRERVNVIRGRLPYFSSLIGVLAGRLLRVPSVVSLGGDNRMPQQREGRYYFGSRALSFGMERVVLRLCDAIIVPNAFTLEYVARLMGSVRAQSKTHVIPWILERSSSAEPSTSGVDLSMLGLADDVPVVLVVGHLNAYKYSREMFDVAHALLTQPGSSVQVVFCGDGPLRAAGEAKLAGLAGAHFPGWQPNAVVLALMQRAAAVLIPMSGFALLEAAANGAPVIASDAEWHGEMIREGDTGWIVPADSVPAWISRVVWVLGHPKEARQAGRRLRELFDRAYSPDAAFRKEAELYQGLTCEKS